MTATPVAAAELSVPPVRVHRVEVRPREGEPDPVAAAALADARQWFGTVQAVQTARVYLIEAALTDEAVQRIAHELLTDPVNQVATVGAASVEEGAVTLEIHYKAGVMDPVAQSTESAIHEMLEDVPGQVAVRTGQRFDFTGLQASAQELDAFASRYLANPVIQEIHHQPFTPDAFPHGHEHAFRLVHVPLRDLDDEALMRLSREAHLFLSLDEMRTIRDYYRSLPDGREPTDIELETLAQTWSEHCVHKTLKATIRYRSQADDPASDIDWLGRPGHEVHEDGSVTIHNLLKSTVAAATRKLMESSPYREWCVSVFKDNAGIVRFDDEDAVCIKVETHNHPSAIEPYGGAATGIGGCIRDVMGTGLSARPIANTDVFAVAWRQEGNGEGDAPLPKGVIHPRRILQQVVAGVRDYGNRMGIPTVNGAVVFHENYLGNPLVFAGCVGVIPLDKCFGAPKPGDRIVALGGATGRDGIHGATFSSAELTDTHADEFSHAVQIGNAITQKKMMDVILQARDYVHEDGTSQPLYHAITDCGAGGFSSAVGEMGEKLGARVTLEKAPLKYAGLTYTEVWISEAQERMVLAVPPEHMDKLAALCAAEDVSMCDLGEFGCTDAQGNPELVLTWHDNEVGRLSMKLLHEGIPMPTREAAWSPGGASAAALRKTTTSQQADMGETLHRLLAHPDIASKHWIIRQYDHEVQGGSVVKPLVGPVQDGPSDAAVLRPKLGSNRGIAVGCGLQPHLSETAADAGIAIDGDSYWMALAAIDEAVRNVICVGADPQQIAILDNFCWPKCDDPRQLGALVRAAEACYDGALAYRTPFISGKDSLSNQFTTEDGRIIAIPQTLLITALGIVPDVLRSRTMDAKAPGNVLLLVGETTAATGGSHLRMVGVGAGEPCIPRVDLQRGPANARAVAELIAAGLVQSAHDCSDGGVLVTAAEMAFAGRVGLDIDLDAVPTAGSLDELVAAFAETPSRYLLEVAPQNVDAVVRKLRAANVRFAQVGTFADHDRLTVRTARRGRILDESLDALRQTWLGTLDW